jgi:hypothetical protein
MLLVVRQLHMQQQQQYPQKRMVMRSGRCCPSRVWRISLAAVNVAYCGWEDQQLAR